MFVDFLIRTLDAMFLWAHLATFRHVSGPHALVVLLCRGCHLVRLSCSPTSTDHIYATIIRVALANLQ